MAIEMGENSMKNREIDNQQLGILNADQKKVAIGDIPNSKSVTAGSEQLSNVNPTMPEPTAQPTPEPIYWNHTWTSGITAPERPEPPGTSPEPTQEPPGTTRTPGTHIWAKTPKLTLLGENKGGPILPQRNLKSWRVWQSNMLLKAQFGFKHESWSQTGSSVLSV